LTGVLAVIEMTILLPTVLMRAGHRQIKGSQTMRAGRHQMRITDGTMGHHRRINRGRTITRRHRRHRRIETETEIVTETQTGTVITTATGMANRVTTCTRLPELL
jgi:hypothetical protein